VAAGEAAGVETELDSCVKPHAANTAMKIMAPQDFQINLRPARRIDGDECRGKNIL
jgi:hypothetical protein